MSKRCYVQPRPPAFRKRPLRRCWSTALAYVLKVSIGSETDCKLLTGGCTYCVGQLYIPPAVPVCIQLSKHSLYSTALQTLSCHPSYPERVFLCQIVPKARQVVRNSTCCGAATCSTLLLHLLALLCCCTLFLFVNSHFVHHCRHPVAYLCTLRVNPCYAVAHKLVLGPAKRNIPLFAYVHMHTLI